MWDTLTEPQAILLSGILSGSLTIVAATLGVWLGSRLFGGRISDLQSLLSESNQHLDNHRADVKKKVDDLIHSTGDVQEQAAAIRETRDSLRELGEVINAQLSSAIDGISVLKASVSDIQDAQGAAPQENATADSEELRRSIRENWGAIRKTIEGIASNPTIDGRTRAKYGRIDRRQYWALLEELHKDGRIDDDYELFSEANNIWQRFKSNRTNPTPEDAQTMKVLEQTLTHKYTNILTAA